MDEPDFQDITKRMEWLSHTVALTVDVDILSKMRKRRSYPPALDNWFLAAELVPGGSFRARFFRLRGGFSVGRLAQFLASRGLALGKTEHLMALTAGGGLRKDLGSVAALGSECLVDWDTDFRGAAYPIRWADGSWGGLEIDRKEFNKNDFHWVDEAVTVLVVEPYVIAQSGGTGWSVDQAPERRDAGGPGNTNLTAQISIKRYFSDRLRIMRHVLFVSLFLFVISVIGALGWFVWPTPWRLIPTQGPVFRENRFTGEIQKFTPSGWR